MSLSRNIAFILCCCSALIGCAAGSINLSSMTEFPIDRELIALPARQSLVKHPGGVTRSPPSSTTKDTAKEFELVTVLWGSNRKIINQNPVQLTSSNSKKLHVGLAHITIPKIGRDKGSIPRPLRYSILNLNLYTEKEDPKKHFTIGDLKVLSPEQFLKESNSVLSLSNRFQGEAFVFVHGYNTSFEATLFRTAQLAYDIGFDGAIYAYSWPSQANISGYMFDRDMADGARRYLKEFLELIAKNTNAKRIHLIAHSMGSRPLLDVLRQSPKKLKKLKIDQLIFAAPDIHRDVFEDIAGRIASGTQGTTLYASNNDVALAYSRTIAGGNQRAGEIVSGNPTIVEGVETIDITQASRSSQLFSLNHSSFSERSHIITDIKMLLQNGVHPPQKRFPVFIPITTNSGKTYWQYQKNQ